MRNDIVSTAKKVKGSQKEPRQGINRKKISLIPFIKQKHSETIIGNERQQGLQSRQSILRLDHLIFKPKTLSEILYNLGDIEDLNLRMVLHHLYLCCKRRNKAIQAHNFSKTDTIKDCIVYVENLISETLGENKDYRIIEFINDSTKRLYKEYRIEQYKIHNTDQQGYFISIKFLENLKDQKLRELLIATFAYIRSKIHCCMIGVDDWITSDYQYDMMLDNLNSNEEPDEEEKEQMEKGLQNIEEYHSGKIRALWNEIRDTKVKAKKHLDLVNLENIDDSLFIWIVNITKFLEKESYHVEKFDYNPDDPDWDNGRPVLFSDTIGFYYEEDYMWHEINEYYDSNANELGVMQATQICTWTPTKIQGELINNNWPVQLQKLFGEFINKVKPKIEKL